jgi:hypothetical protein
MLPWKAGKHGTRKGNGKGVPPRCGGFNGNGNGNSKDNGVPLPLTPRARPGEMVGRLNEERCPAGLLSTRRLAKKGR